MTITRFVMIDSNSGYIWGVEDAADAVSACRTMDERIGECGRAYVEHGPRSNDARTTAGGYFVYSAAANFEADNGEDEEKIAIVERMPCVAFVAFNDAA